MARAASELCRLDFAVLNRAEWQVDGGAPEVLPRERPYEILAYLACLRSFRDDANRIRRNIFGKTDGDNLKVHACNLRNGMRLPHSDRRRYPIGNVNRVLTRLGLLEEYCTSDLVAFWEAADQALNTPDPPTRVARLRAALGMAGGTDARVLPGMEAHWSWVGGVNRAFQEEVSRLRSELRRTESVALPPPTPLETQTRAFLGVLGVEVDTFLRDCPGARRLFQRDPERLRNGRALTLAGALQMFLDRVTLCDSEPELNERYSALRRAGVGFVFRHKDRVLVSPRVLTQLYGAYGTPEVVPGNGDAALVRVEQELPPEALSADVLRELSVVFVTYLGGLSRGELDRELGKSFREVMVRSLREGCTVIDLEVSPVQAERLSEAAASGELARAGLRRVDRIDPGEAPPDAAGPRVDLSQPDAGVQLFQVLRAAVHRERQSRPWRRLRLLFSPHIHVFPDSVALAESAVRAYALPGSDRGKGRALATDLGMTLFLWPLLTALLLGVVLGILRALTHRVDVGFGVASGILLSLVGAQVCSSLVSPVACGAGGIAIGCAFGIAHALGGPLLSAGWLAGARDDLFLPVVGGPVGLSAPTWQGAFGRPGSLALLALVATGIATAGWLMGQPQRAAGKAGPVWAPRTRRRRGWLRAPRLAGAGRGALAGLPIGLLYGICRVLAPAFPHAGALVFLAGFGSVGSCALGLAGWGKTGSRKTSAACVAFHLLATAVLGFLVLHTRGRLPLLMELSAFSGFFHATWFTTAFVWGELAGSGGAGVTAAIIEGAVGFSAFVLARMMLG